MTTRERKPKHSGWVLLLTGLTLALGCTKAGTSIVSVDVAGVGTDLSDLASVTITVTPQSGTAASATFTGMDWTQKNSFGVKLGSGVSGAATVSAQGFAASSATTAIAREVMAQMVTVTPGQKTAVLTIQLKRIPPGSGTGGQGGMASGTGGTGGGAGGGMSNPGSGGASGGSPGTGGMAGHGTGGIVGPGTGGAAGSGAGTGGASNSGGSGMGGGGPGGKAGRAWQGASLAESNTLVDNYTPAVAVDSKGNIVAVYIHGSGLAASHYDIATGVWGTEVNIDASAMTNVSWPNIAVDKTGNWLVVWQQDASIPQHGIWQSTSADGLHWTAPAAIATTGSLFTPVLGMNQDGMAVVVWNENVPPDNHFTMTGSARVNGTWTAPHVLLAGVDTGEQHPAVAVTGTGTGIVTWEQADDTAAGQLSVWQARFSAGAWSTASLVETFTGGEAYSASVATNNAGQAVLSWLQDTTSTKQLWVQRYPATGAPETPAMVAEASSIAWTPPPALTLDESGSATAAWASLVKMKYNVSTSRAAWGQSWAPAMAMETDDDAANDMANGDDYAWVTSPMLGHDTAGNVALVWKKRKGLRFDMWARNYDAGSGAWGPGVLLETQDDHEVFAPAMAMGPSGVAVATWVYTYEYEIWANVYR